MGVFFGFVFGVGAFFLMYDIEKHETSDEHYWKETRIDQYWDGLKEGLTGEGWEKTAINDKPGVSLAMISGLALPFVPDTDTHVVHDRERGKWLYRVYRVENTSGINFGLRLPVAIFSLLMMMLSVWMVYLWKRSFFFTAIFSLLFVFHPVLLGLSRILNPDSIFWSTAFISFLSFLFVLEGRGRRWVMFSGVFFAFAVLAKYTANLLVIFFLIALLVYVLFSYARKKDFFGKTYKAFFSYFGIIALGWGLFALGMPAVFGYLEWFTYGTVFSPALKPVILLLSPLLLLLLIDVFILKGKVLKWISLGVLTLEKLWPKFFAGAFLLLVAFHLFNAYTDESLMPLNNIKEVVRGEVGGGRYADALLYPHIQEDGVGMAFVKKIMVHSADTIFSTPTVVLLFLILGCILVFWKEVSKATQRYLLIALSIPWVFFIGGILSETFVNTRYAIFLQPLWVLLATLFVWEFLHLFSRRGVRNYIKGVLLGGTVLGMAIALWSIIPHYINYQNIFLPKEYVITDSWSYGVYEAAQYLNQKPFAEYMEVWSDRSAFCEHFVGKCLKSATADRAYVSPDYIITTRRNVVKDHRFTWKNQEGKKYLSPYYYDTIFNNPEWSLAIGGRKENYIKIFLVEKETINTQERQKWVEWE